MDTNIVTNTTIDNSLIMENQDALFTNILNNIDPGDVTIEPADGVALADQVAPTQLQDRIPVPTNYVISAKFKITPAAFVGADVPAEVQERMINVEVTLAWLVPADIANQGGWENFVQAASQGALFVAFKFPNDPKTIVFATNPSQRTVQIGHGFNQPFNLGLVTGAVWGNYRGAVDPDSLPESAPLDPGLELSGRIGVTMTVPAISRLISNALAATVDVASGLITGALLASGAGSPLALAADYIGSILENVVRTGSFGIGASWRGEISTNAEEVTLYGPLGTRAYNREDFARAALTFMAWDMRNFGIPEIAYSKMQWQLEQGSSYFQLSPVTGGWSRITTQGSAIEVVPRRNYGDPGMALINYLNVWGQAVAQDAADPNATSPLTYRDLTPPPAANGLPSRQWVRMYQNIDSGPEAVAVVQHLKQTLSPATWQQFLEGLRPMAEPLGLNLGLSELNPVAPATPELQQARAYLDRDWNKNSNPQETRYIEEIPSDIYNQIRADLGLDLVAGNGTWVIPDYYDPNLPTGDPALEELFPSDFTDITYANLTDDEVQVDAVALTPIDGVVLHTGDGGGKYTGTERNDIMRGAAGIDNLDGGAGDDLVIGTGPEDTLTGGEGNDIAAYLASQTGVTLDLSNLANVVDVEAVGGSDFADTIVTSTARNLPVYGFAGDDIITGSEGAIVYSDFSPEFLERFGASLGLDAENLPGGNDEIDMKNAATGTVLAGGGNDTVYIDMTATVGADGRSVINLPTGLTLDGGEGTDRLVLRVVNPDSGLLVYSIPDLPGNMTNFERVQVGTNIVGVPGISSAPVAHNAPEGWQNARGTPDVISGNGAWPGGGGLEVSNVSGPSPFGGTMGLLVSTPNNGWEETINTTLTGLTVGQTYTTQFAWQQASVLNDPSGLLEGGSVRVRIGDEVREIQPIGTAASDDWQIETISFTATAETMEFEVSSVGNRNGAIVVDTFGPNVALQNTLTSVAENANAERSVKVGDIAVNGDSGNLQLSLAGPDADKFEIVGTELYLKSGVPVDYETQQSLTVSIVADDPATVNIDTQTDFTIAIENIDTLELRNTVTSIRENTPTDASLPVADVVAEPAVGPLVLEGPDAGKFEIVNGQLFLKAGTVLDYEAQQTLNVTVRADDASNTEARKDLQIAIGNIDVFDVVNQPYQNAGIDENTDTTSRLLVGDVVFDGPPSNFNVTLTGTDADKFEIIDNKLYLKPGVVLDYEALPNDGYGSIGYQVDLVADDLTTPQADDATRTINLRINDLDDTARVSFTNEVYSLPENSDTAQPIRIADLTLTNAPDGAYALTLAGNDADKFEIAGNQLFLKAGAALDYETQSSFDVRVQVDDLRTPAAIDDEQYVSFSVEDVNAARVVNRPYENTGIDETIDTTNGVLVGDIILDGPASNFNLTLTGPDADRFQIVGNQLFIKPGAVIDYETEPVVSYGAMPELEVTLEADDLTTPQVGDGGDTVTISINDVNENV